MTDSSSLLVAAALLRPLLIATVANLQSRKPVVDFAAQAALLVLAATALAGSLWVADPESLGLAMPSWTTPLLAIGLAAFFIFVWGPLLGLLAPNLFDRGLARLAALGRKRILIAVLVGGFAEEILYRVVGFGLLAAMTGAPVAAAAVSIVAYALAHWPLWGGMAALSFVPPAAILTAAYYWTGDLTALIFAHVVTDVLGLRHAQNMSNADKDT